MQITVDHEFHSLIPALSQEERSQLEANIKAEGCRDPLVIWNHTIVDGHNRYEICSSNSIDFKTVELDLPDRDAAKAWIIKNQLGRRNLSPKQMSYLRGMQYEMEKTIGHGVKKTARQNVGQFDTAERLGNEHGVDARTIERDAAFAASVEKLVSVVGDEARSVVLNGDASLTRGEVVTLAKEVARNPAKAPRIVKQKLDEAKKKKEVKASKVKAWKRKPSPRKVSGSGEVRNEEPSPSALVHSAEDEAWLSTFPLRKKVIAHRFDEDALLYRHFAPILIQIKEDIRKIVGQRSPVGMCLLHQAMYRIVDIAEIKHWYLCECGGRGCRKCHQGGYRIPGI